MARKTRQPDPIQFGKPSHQLRNDILLTLIAAALMLATLAGVVYL